MLSREEVKSHIINQFKGDDFDLISMDSIELVTFLADLELFLKENEIEKKLLVSNLLDNLKDYTSIESFMGYLYE